MVPDCGCESTGGCCGCSGGGVLSGLAAKLFGGCGRGCGVGCGCDSGCYSGGDVFTGGCEGCNSGYESGYGGYANEGNGRSLKYYASSESGPNGPAYISSKAVAHQREAARVARLPRSGEEETREAREIRGSQETPEVASPPQEMQTAPQARRETGSAVRRAGHDDGRVRKQPKQTRRKAPTKSQSTRRRPSYSSTTQRKKGSQSVRRGSQVEQVRHEDDLFDLDRSASTVRFAERDE